MYKLIVCGEDEWMVEAELGVGLGAFPRRRCRSAEERRLIVEETLESGTSVARVAQKYGINANQVFQWRRLYRDGHLGGPPETGMKLLPVSLAEAEEEAVKPAPLTESPVGPGAIHIELPGGIRIGLEGKVDPAIVRLVLQSLRG
ncbi:MAG TPA: transposase [Nitrospira sp.]|nr:transposase [Nitrospira sp.]